MNLAKKLIYPKNLKRVILVLLSVMVITVITMGAVNDALLKKVTLTQIDEFIGINVTEEYRTRKATVGEFLEENGIVVGEADFVSKDITEEIADEDNLIIRKGKIVELSVDGRIEILNVTKPTVGQVLEEVGITLSETDVVTPQKEEAVTDRMQIVVDRYVTEYVTETEVIEFETEQKKDYSLASGKTKVAVTGKNGEKEVTYSLLYKNGEVISKDFVSETVTKEPVTHVVKVGTKKVSKSTKSTKSSNSSTTQAVASAGTYKDFSYSKKLTVTATAYDSSPAENGGYSKTAYGLTPQYGVIAVDPKVIPLGTKLYVESSDGGKSWTYGYCIAGDTGGAIKGNKIDLCFNTKSECVRFGRKSATVYVLN